ncbi:MAG: NAD kinase [Bacteroidales bacterium]|nr:NAD kinase [Bacteroidales bacterium]
MKIGLFGKTFSIDQKSYLQQMIDQVEKSGVELMVYESYYNLIQKHLRFENQVNLFHDHRDIADNIQFLISVGGDGTLLDTISLVQDSGIPVLGVNMGRMGFLSSVSKDDGVAAIDALISNRFKIEQRSLIRLETEAGIFGKMNYALNELSVYKKDPHSMLTIRVFVDDLFLNSYWADGLIIATPTGSTAYSLSCGGPIVVPGSKNFTITPIATHNLTVRPIVIPDKCVIKIKVEGREKKIFVSLDSRFELIDSSIELKVLKETFCINMIQLESKNFYKTIREKLNWGRDIRN